MYYSIMEMQHWSIYLHVSGLYLVGELTLHALEMWLLATMTHSMPCSTSTGMALSVNTISAGKKPTGIYT